VRTAVVIIQLHFVVAEQLNTPTLLFCCLQPFLAHVVALLADNIHCLFWFEMAHLLQIQDESLDLRSHCLVIIVAGKRQHPGGKRNTLLFRRPDLMMTLVSHGQNIQ
jgi:hypothetical protein